MGKLSPEMTILAPDPRKHRSAIFDLLGKTFPGGYYYWQKISPYYLGHASYDWAASRIALLGDELVGHVGIWDYQMRVGLARLKTAGIGAVATSGKYRKLGIGRKVFTAINQSMRENGYDYSVLFGIENYYDKFGYSAIWPDSWTELAIGNVPQVALTLKRRALRSGQIPQAKGAAGRIYNRDYASLVGTAERPVYTREWRKWKEFEFVDARGTAQAYAMVQVEGPQLMVLEVGGFDTHERRMELLGQLRLLAEKSKCTAIHLKMGLEHPLAVLARRYKCTVTTEYKQSGGAMGLVVNLPQMLGKMASELSERAKASVFASSFTGDLLLGAGEGKATLNLNRGKVRLADHAGKAANRIVGGNDMSRLVLGSDDPDAVIDAGEIQCSGKGRELARALFPRRYPWLCRPDGF